MEVRVRVNRDKDPAKSWEANASAWTAAVRDGAIASRRLGTDAAVVDAVLAHRPRRVLDVGCGEGWLARALALHGVDVTGIDASQALVESARELGGGRFHVCPFDGIEQSAELRGRQYDVIVCNFALLDEDVSSTLRALKGILERDGALIIQTVHPWTARDGTYVDGWRTETFEACGAGFRESMPWYFRTLQSWVETLRLENFQIAAIREPRHPESGEPLSVIFEGTIQA